MPRHTMPSTSSTATAPSSSRCSRPPAARAPEAMARRALDVARRLEAELAALGARLARELDVHAACSIAVHAGPVVTGPVGAGDERRQLAAGDGVDVLEALLGRAEREERT